jgi:hypothetical protein
MTRKNKLWCGQTADQNGDHFHHELKCFVEALSYCWQTQTGIVYLDHGGCTDMPGCVTLFQRIDPNVKRIQTVSSSAIDTVYFKKAGKWEARCPDLQRYEVVSPRPVRIKELLTRDHGKGFGILRADR